MLIRLGNENDIDELERLYDAVNDHLASNINYPGWKKGVYPTREDAVSGVKDGCLFTARENGEIIGSIILRSAPEPAYLGVHWHEELDYDDVFVIHTFVVHPKWLKKGVGRGLLDFAAERGSLENKRALRLDVYENNLPALRLYEKCGFEYVATVSMGLEQRGLNWFKLYDKHL